MKISIIGGGNMGGAIACGLSQGSFFQADDITVIDINEAPLKNLQSFNPSIRTSLKSYESIAASDIILLAIKPWLIKDTLLNIKFLLDYNRHILVSVAAGISIEEINKILLKSSDGDASAPVIFRIIPNTAISVLQSVTLISSHNASPEQEDLLCRIFDELGCAILMDENKLSAGTALSSCGIAYLFRYVRAASLAGVELGFYPAEAQNLIVKTMLGAASLLDKTKENPEKEIDKVTTPGGITIKGLNELEANGFSNAIIKAIKASK
ncbi:MAG: pyrroline-5-carboxylate reductase [Dysgonamonadaceae bacterium]|jgi:pyrroline-5-carboxylate reductase|nr:pyrroline-5-carboxylate reductase [Dysgonamonadaceae bacterium]